jgi:hypothetical protein
MVSDYLTDPAPVHRPSAQPGWRDLTWCELDYMGLFNGFRRNNLSKISSMIRAVKMISHTELEWVRVHEPLISDQSIPSFQNP